MPQDEVAEVTQPITDISPFDEKTWKSAPTNPEPLTEEKTEPTLEVKDPVIKEKDEEIKIEKPISDKPDEPFKIPAATPPPIQDLPPEKKKLDEIKAEVKSTLLNEETEDEIFEVLNKRHILKNLDKLPPEEKIKLQLKNQNKDYSEQEINDLFNEKYSLPEEPERDLTDSEDEFEAKENKYKEKLGIIQRRIERHAKDAAAGLQKDLQELNLPHIPQNPNVEIEPTQEELDRFEILRAQNLQAIEGSLNELNSYNATYKDKEIEIPLAYSIAKEEKEELKPLLDSLNTNLPQFFQQLEWLDKDGKLNTQKVVNDLHILKNKEKVIQKFVNEAGNKRYAEAVKKQKNVDFSEQPRRGSLDPSAREEAEKKVSSFLAAT